MNEKASLTDDQVNERTLRSITKHQRGLKVLTGAALAFWLVAMIGSIFVIWAYFLMYLPKSDIIELSMSVEEAAKAVISAGLVMPEFGAPGAGPQMLSKTAAASIIAATAVQPARSSLTASSRPNK